MHLLVEGSDSEEAYLICDNNPNERRNVESVAHLANALNSERLDDASLVRIFWPKSKCSLLHDDVVLMDSPGIDVTPNLDEWIDKHCLDADVFVLVSNAESTLMRTEKAFFHKVSQKLSKPNIFILNNRWDAVAAEPENLDLVRKQHLERGIDFLCDELNVINRAEADDRVFFVSAKEVLLTRQSLLNQTTLPTFPDGYEHRYRDFEEFETKFEECLSRSAIKTKFDQHAKRGYQIITALQSILEEVHTLSANLKDESTNKRQELQERLVQTQQEMHKITNEVKMNIFGLVGQVEGKVSAALTEEIRRLSLLVNDYERPFNAESLVLTVYKKELHSHVERGLGSNLRARLSTALTGCVESSQAKMISRISSLIPTEAKKASYNLDVKPRQNFEVFYRLNCESLCSDFQEDLEFRFSLGLISMIKRFSNKNPFRKDTIPRPMSSPSPMTDNSLMSDKAVTDNMMLVIVERFATSPQSQTTLGALALGGFMVRTIGWRVIGVTCGIYALLYLYERLTWTNKAKEHSFKKQYVNHATKKLKLIVDLTSANCSHQVQQ